jgi:hypothetical protein
MGGKDVPCNTVVYFDLRGGVLNMMVSNRSNDALWGAFGANAVHFSVLHEYLAARIGAPVGKYHQVSNNLHVYTGVYPVEKLKRIAADAEATNHYARKSEYFEAPAEEAVALPMVTNPAFFLSDAEMFLAEPSRVDAPFHNEWFASTAVPVYRAWISRSIMDLVEIKAPDWRLACTAWLDRRSRRAAK